MADMGTIVGPNPVGFSRSAYHTVMKALLDNGLVETRFAYAPKSCFVRVYVRSERCLAVLGDLTLRWQSTAGGIDGSARRDLSRSHE